MSPWSPTQEQQLPVLSRNSSLQESNPSGTGHDWEEDFKGFGCSVHINSVSNLCTISRGNLKIPVWVLGFIFLVCVLSPCTKEADPLIKAFIKLAKLSFSPSLNYPVWMLITVITQFILNEMLTMIPTDQQNKIKKNSGKKKPKTWKIFNKDFFPEFPIPSPTGHIPLSQTSDPLLYNCLQKRS